MSEIRETIIELPEGKRVIVQTSDRGTQVHAMDGELLATFDADTHADRVSEYASAGGKVVIGADS
jgi:nitrite reductase/ring-hydroxylating ferredoxin subunit